MNDEFFDGEDRDNGATAYVGYVLGGCLGAVLAVLVICAVAAWILS